MNNYNRDFITLWPKIKRLLALVTAVLLWIISIVFSYKGFNFSTNHSMAWAGIIMAFAVTVLELIFNTNSIESLLGDRNAEFGEWILVIGGLLAYVYDIWTNIIGILAVQGKSFDLTTWSVVVPILVGTFMAILPEPMFVWSMGIKGLSGQVSAPRRPIDTFGTKPSSAVLHSERPTRNFLSETDLLSIKENWK